MERMEEMLERVAELRKEQLSDLMTLREIAGEEEKQERKGEEEEDPDLRDQARA